MSTEQFIKNLAKEAANPTNMANVSTTAKVPQSGKGGSPLGRAALGVANAVGRAMQTPTGPSSQMQSPSGAAASVGSGATPANVSTDKRIKPPKAGNVISEAAQNLFGTTTQVSSMQPFGGTPAAEAEATPMNITSAGVNIPVKEIPSFFETAVINPYRKKVSPRLAATMLVMNPEWRKDNADVVGNTSLAETFFTNTPAYDKAIEDAKNLGISPGRSLVYGLGAVTSGATGQETAVENIDWENADEIEQFYNQGAPQFWSGTADFGFYNLDPAFLVTRAGGNAYKLAFRVRVTPENQAKVIETVYRGAEGKGPAAPFFDAVAKASREDLPSQIERHPILADNPRASQMSSQFVEAYRLGGNNKVADMLAVAYGDSAAFERITAEADSLSIRYQVMKEKNDSLKSIMNDIVEKVGADGPGYETVDGLEQFIIPNLSESVSATQREIDLANKIGTWLPGFQNKMDQTQQQLRIAQMISGATIEGTTTRVGGVLADLDRTFTSIPTKLGETVARANEARRAATAARLDDYSWSIQRSGTAAGENVLYWVNPSAQLNELPSGMAQFSGPAGNRSIREADARLKNLGRHVPEFTGAEARAMRTTYAKFETKIDQYKWFDDLQSFGTMKIIGKHVDISELDAKQLDILQTVVTEMTAATKRAQSRAMSQVLRDERYSTIYNNEKVIVPQFEQLIKDLADSRAADLGKPMADSTDVNYIINNLLNDTPAMESQVPGVHIGIDFGLIDNWANENTSSLQYMVNRLTSNPKISKSDIKTAVRVLEEERKIGPISIAETKGETWAEVKDLILAGYSSYIDSIWKPITLLSFRYTTRNVAEGLGRVLALGLEYHDDRGYGYSDMIGDFVTDGSLQRTKRNIASRKAIKQQTRGKFLRAGDFDKSFKAATVNMTDIQRQAQRTVIGANDSIGVSVNDLRNVKQMLDSYNPTAKTRETYDELVYAIDTAFNSKIPDSVDVTFTQLLLDGKPLDAWEYAMGKPSKENQVWQQRVTDEVMIRSLQHIDDRVNAALGSIAGSVTGTHAGLDTIIANIVSAANNISTSVNASKLALLSAMELKGELGKLIANREEILNRVINAGEGTIEIIPGVYIPDAYANSVGQIMRGQVSAASSTSSTVLNARRSVTSDIFGRNNGLTDVMPTKISDTGDGYVVNPNWAISHAEYINTKFANSGIAKRIFAGESNEDIYKWLNGSDPLAKKVRDELDWTLDRYPSAPGKKNKWWNVIERTRADIETQLPRVGNDNLDLMPLRQKILDGTFTQADSLTIPEILRVPVKGIDIVGGDINIAKAYRNFLNRLFDNLATKPEDRMVRHPFYRTVYRNEARRVARLLESSGINAADAAPRIAERAHQVAYQQVMERLYSIERYTNVAGVMKYVSPFYMAQQNSARFWLGAAARRPQLPVRMLQVWNAPNQVFDVRDEKGNKVEWSFPWQSGGETLYVPIAKELKPYFGNNDYFGLNKSSADLVFQGQVPMMPQFSSPAFDASLSVVLAASRGTKYDPDYFLTNTLGLEPNLLIDRIAPYYRPLPGAGPVNKAFQSAIPTSSWMRGLLNWSVGATGFAASKGYANSYASRLDAAYRANLAKRSESGVPVTAQEDADLYKAAHSQATNSFLWESVLSFGFPIIPVKLKRNNELEAQTLRGLQQELGYDEGTIEYTMRQEGLATAVTTAVASTASDNKFGLYATPETMRNLKSYAELNDGAQRYYDAAGKALDSRVIGYFMNEGDPRNFSTVQNEGLYSHKINGKTVKVKGSDEASNKANINVTAGWTEYFSLINALDKVKQGSMMSGNGIAKSEYDDAKKKIKEYVELQYPIWAVNNGFNDADKQKRDHAVIYTYLNNKKFMNDKAKSNKVVEISDLYFNKVRPQLVADLGEDSLSDRSDIAEKHLQVVDALKMMYTDKASTNFIEQFIAEDKFSYIDPKNPLG